MPEELLSLIPHRPPFLYVDKIVDISENHIATEKRIDPNEPFFRGHYPQTPVMPGVLVCESIFQSGAILVAKMQQSTNIPNQTTKQEKVPVLTRIREAKFKRMVLPGDLLEVEVNLTEELGGAYFMNGVARVNGKVSVRVEFAAILAEVNPSEEKEN
jgi:3-hydroxyacyl-[acyl-carrier-protein] dehydratase